MIWNRSPFLFWTLFCETFSECFDHSTFIFFISVLRLLHFYDYESHYRQISVILIDEDIFSHMKFERKLYRRHQVRLSSSLVGDIQGSDEGEQIGRFSDILRLSKESCLESACHAYVCWAAWINLQTSLSSHCTNWASMWWRRNRIQRENFKTVLLLLI